MWPVGVPFAVLEPILLFPNDSREPPLTVSIPFKLLFVLVTFEMRTVAPVPSARMPVMPLFVEIEPEMLISTVPTDDTAKNPFLILPLAILLVIVT